MLSVGWNTNFKQFQALQLVKLRTDLNPGNQTSNLCWTRNGPNPGPILEIPCEQQQVCLPKPNYNTKKTHSNPPKNPNLQTESSTQHLNSELKSQHSLGSMNRKWNLTWQHKTLLGIWKICTLVSLLNGQHQCFFFHSPTINTMYSEISFFCLMKWPGKMLQILPFH